MPPPLEETVCKYKQCSHADLTLPERALRKNFRDSGCTQHTAHSTQRQDISSNARFLDPLTGDISAETKHPLDILHRPRNHDRVRHGEGLTAQEVEMLQPGMSGMLAQSEAMSAAASVSG